jgi:hypothetical protein
MLTRKKIRNALRKECTDCKDQARKLISGQCSLLMAEAHTADRGQLPRSIGGGLPRFVRFSVLAYASDLQLQHRSRDAQLFHFGN